MAGNGAVRCGKSAVPYPATTLEQSAIMSFTWTTWRYVEKVRGPVRVVAATFKEEKFSSAAGAGIAYG